MGRPKKAGKAKPSKRPVEEPERSAPVENVEVVTQESETMPETQQAEREGEQQVNELENEEVHIPNDDIAFEEDANLSQGSHSTGGCSSANKKKGRGPGIGVKPGHGIHLEIHDNRIVTPQAAHELTAIFKRSITGPWIRFSEYHASALQTVIACFKESGFTCSLPEEELNVHLKEHIKSPSGCMGSVTEYSLNMLPLPKGLTIHLLKSLLIFGGIWLTSGVTQTGRAPVIRTKPILRSLRSLLLADLFPWQSLGLIRSRRLEKNQIR
ncbi:unnamed protein product [Linum tenue]|uniref:Uncharacterized protein n=1 Tax=Linum tenue TaxID=586396 RepID=A0AAV0RRA5_9ROSI|nr:unnamed protein product [Linum tenue]